MAVGAIGDTGTICPKCKKRWWYDNWWYDLEYEPSDICLDCRKISESICDDCDPIGNPNCNKCVGS